MIVNNLHYGNIRKGEIFSPSLSHYLLRSANTSFKAFVPLIADGKPE